ncbi:MAG: NUDIX hydrolase [Pseudomonadota bacterium]
MSAPALPVLAVGAVVFRNGCVLLVLRGNPPAMGTWAIPGGKVRLGETLRRAAEREILEETGIRVRAGEPVLAFEVIDRDPAGAVRFHYYIVDLEAEYEGGEIRPGDDAADARWVTERELEILEVNPRTREFLKQRYGFGK